MENNAGMDWRFRRSGDVGYLMSQLDNGVVTSDGGAGADWLAEYDLEVIKVD